MRTRFAPSPTGFLHVGGLRTALFAWLIARQTKGTFFLRIEDTDRTREVEGATENILRTLGWAGLQPDEGVVLHGGGIIEKGEYGPYFQSKRRSIYHQYAQQMLAAGHAYRCFCTVQRLDEMRKDQERRKQAPMYDRACLELTPEEAASKLAAGQPHVVRLKVPRDETIRFHDEIYGDLTFLGHTVDDQVLLKSDGFPTYHLAHVVDDHLMHTDMVTRGEEWLSSLPKHLLLFRFLGWQPPKYGHVPLLLNTDRTKLSKRQNDAATEHYIERGYLPEAMLNFLALLGWNPGTTQEIFSLQELTLAFSLDRVQKSGAIFDLKKLDWLQGQWMRRIPVGEFATRIQPIVARRYPASASDERFALKAGLIQQRITFFAEAADMLSFFYERPQVQSALVVNPKQGVSASDLPAILDVLEKSLSSIPEDRWTLDTIRDTMSAAIASSGRKRGQVLWTLRAVLTGRPYSPGAFEVAATLGKQVTMERIIDTAKALT